MCFWRSLLRLDRVLTLDSADATDSISDFHGSTFCRILGVVRLRRYFAGLIFCLGGLIGFGLLVGLGFSLARFFGGDLIGYLLGLSSCLDGGLMYLRRGFLRLDRILTLDSTDATDRFVTGVLVGSAGSDSSSDSSGSSAATSSATASASAASSTAASCTSGAASCASTASSPSTTPTPPTESASSSSAWRFGFLVRLVRFFGGDLICYLLGLSSVFDCSLMYLRRSFLRLDRVLTLDNTHATDRISVVLRLSFFIRRGSREQFG